MTLSELFSVFVACVALFIVSITGLGVTALLGLWLKICVANLKPLRRLFTQFRELWSSEKELKT